MKLYFVSLILLTLILANASCELKSEICECFETRLEIKKLLKSSEKIIDLSKSEEYKKLIARKEKCMTTIEPNYFSEKGIERKGRGDKEFLLDELGDCQAVRELLRDRKSVV